MQALFAMTGGDEGLRAFQAQHRRPVERGCQLPDCTLAPGVDRMGVLHFLQRVRWMCCSGVKLQVSSRSARVETGEAGLPGALQLQRRPAARRPRRPRRRDAAGVGRQRRTAGAAAEGGVAVQGPRHSCLRHQCGPVHLTAAEKLRGGFAQLGNCLEQRTPQCSGEEKFGPRCERMEEAPGRQHPSGIHASTTLQPDEGLVGRLDQDVMDATSARRKGNHLGAAVAASCLYSFRRETCVEPG
eukprot:s518_g14.t1